MGIIYMNGIVKGSSDVKETVRFLVDSGAGYTLLPFKVWKKLELKSKRQEKFALADGTLITRDMSECYIYVAEMEGHTPVVLGELGDQALLGVITLEQFGLVLNPFTRQLQPMRLMLA